MFYFSLVNSSGLSDGYQRPLQKQGLNDQARLDYILGGGHIDTANARMQAQADDFGPSVRIHNFYWRAVESSVFSQTTPVNCPVDSFMAPANEQEKTSKGYNKYRCILKVQVDGFKNALALNKKYNIQNAVVFWTTPKQYQDESCQGVEGAVGKDPCIFKDEYEPDWQDWMTFVADYFNDIDHYIIWNEVASNLWLDYSPKVPNAGPYNAQQTEDLVAKIVRMMTLASTSLLKIKGANSGKMLYVSLDQIMKAPQDQTRGHIGSETVIMVLSKRVGTQFDMSYCMHFYGPADQTGWPDVAHFADAPKLVEMIEFYLDKKDVVQTLIAASEQGITRNDHTQTQIAEWICKAHDQVSRCHNLIWVTNNFFQANALNPSDVFSLVEFSIKDDLSDRNKDLSYQAYMSTSVSRWNKSNDHWCCANVHVGCV